VRTKKFQLDDSDLAMFSALKDYVHDPLGYVMFAFPWGQPGTFLSNKTGPRKWQADVLDYIGDRLRSGAVSSGEVIRTAVASGHGIGKSALVAMLINWAQDTCPGCRTVVTANTESQLLSKTWPEVAKWHNVKITAKYSQCTKTAMFSSLDAANWRADIQTWSEHNTEAFAGLHNEGKRLLLIFDEASSIPEAVNAVANGALTDADTEIIWCQFGNPTQNSGPFFDCFHSLAHRWKRWNIDARTVEGTNSAFHSELIEDNGIDSDIVKVRVLGQFPNMSAKQFIATSAVKNAMATIAETYDTDVRVIGVDVARHGDDQSVIAKRTGLRVDPLIKMRIPDTMILAAKVAQEIDEFAPDAVFIDATGMGWGVYDRLRQLGYADLVVPIETGKSSTDVRKFKILRDEIWDNIKTHLDQGMTLPDDQELLRDLTTPEYSFNPRNQLMVESKREMKARSQASPDSADAVGMTVAMPVRKRKPGPVGSWRDNLKSTRARLPMAS
jgi:hypothetical protein